LGQWKQSEKQKPPHFHQMNSIKQLTGLLIFTEHLHRTLIKRLFHHNIFRRTVVDKHQEACNLGEQLKEK
jgi:hypothetical protein